eukprot:UN08895
MHKIFMSIWILVNFGHFAWLPMVMLHGILCLFCIVQTINDLKEICEYLFDLLLILTLLDDIKSKYYLNEQNLLELREIIYTSMCGHVHILSFQQKSNGEYDGQITNLKVKADGFFFENASEYMLNERINQNKTKNCGKVDGLETNRIVKH